MSDSVRPHPWDSPGKNTGVGCHCLLHCMKVKSESEVAQLCPTLRDLGHVLFASTCLWLTKNKFWTFLTSNSDTNFSSFQLHLTPWIWFFFFLLKYSWLVVVVSDSLRPNGQQYTRPPCPSPSPGICPSSCSLHRWCLPAISSSDALFSFCPQSFPASGTFQMSHLLASDDQNTGASASVSVLPVNIHLVTPSIP